MHTENPAALKSDSSEVLVTLVHGTWGRGVFPALRISKKPYWFEPGSSFREGLLWYVQSRGTVCSIDTFLWSGANSIRHRDDAAKRLARQLTEHFRKNPNIRQVILAHSHGGNVVTRALGYLDFDVSVLRVCYLATPFMQLFRREVGDLEQGLTSGAIFFLGIAVSSMFFFLLRKVESFGIANDSLFRVIFPLVAYLLVLFACERLRQYMFSEASEWGNDELVQATKNLRNDQSHGAALILRAIDDEASLALSLGTVANLLSLWVMLVSTLLVGVLGVTSTTMQLLIWDSEVVAAIVTTTMLFLGLIAAVMYLLALVSRGVFGRELIYHPPGIQMNVQTVPDFIHAADIRTFLKADTSLFFALRHGIHSDPNASVVIGDWICTDPTTIKPRPEFGPLTQ